MSIRILIADPCAFCTHIGRSSPPGRRLIRRAPGSMPHPYREPVTTMSTKSVLRPPGATTAARSVSLTDRIAMRLGMALVIWSRRTRTKRLPVDPLLAHQLRQERAAREAEWVMLGATMHLWR
jgi:hypothetical protein